MLRIASTDIEVGGGGQVLERGLRRKVWTSSRVGDREEVSTQVLDLSGSLEEIWILTIGSH